MELGERVHHLARKGTYIARMGNQAYVQWDDESAPCLAPAGSVRSLHDLDVEFVIRHLAQPHKAKGGARTGGRKLKHNPAEKILRRQYIRQKRLRRGMKIRSEGEQPIKADYDETKKSQHKCWWKHVPEEKRDKEAPEEKGD